MVISSTDAHQYLKKAQTSGFHIRTANNSTKNVTATKDCAAKKDFYDSSHEEIE